MPRCVQRDPFHLAEVVAKQERQRVEFGERQNKRALLPLAEARARRQTFDWSTVDIPRPEFLGTRMFTTDSTGRAGPLGPPKTPTPSLPDGAPSGRALPLTLDEIIAYIDWGPFFSAWELHGRYPDILTDAVVGAEATKLFADAQKLLARIVAEKRYTARAVIAFWPANSVGDSVEVYADESRADAAERGDPDAGGGAVDWSRAGAGGGFDGEAADLEALLTREKTLRDHLGDQVQTAFADPVQKMIAGWLVDLVDDAGYIPADLGQAAEKLGVADAEIQAVLAKMQTFEPSGVCARSLAECLALGDRFGFRG